MDPNRIKVNQSETVALSRSRPQAGNHYNSSDTLPFAPRRSLPGTKPRPGDEEEGILLFALF
jgi:hypothetical protein